MEVVEPYVMVSLQPIGATRVNSDVIVLSPTGLTPAKWKETATVCPLDWPSNYSLLRLWHMPTSFHQYAAQPKQQIQHRHMFTPWEVNSAKLASRVPFQRPAHYVPETVVIGSMYKNGSFLTGDYVGEHQQLTGLPFGAKATSYGSLPQGQGGLIRFSSLLGTAGMTPSEQTSNTTLNILHGVRRSDPHPPPPLPLFCGVLPLSSVPSSLSATSRFAPTCCYVVGALLRACVGFCCSLVAPPFSVNDFAICLVRFCFGPCLPALLCPWPCVLASLRAWPLSVCGFVVLVFLPARLLVSFRGRRAPFCVWWAPLCLFCLLFCRHPSRPFVASLPLAVSPLWRPCLVFTLVPPSGYLVVLVTAPGCLALRLGGGRLCCPYFIWSPGGKGLWPCVACSTLYTMLQVLFRRSQYYHTEVFICRDPGPPLDTAKRHYCYSWL